MNPDNTDRESNACKSNAPNLSALADGELRGWTAFRLRRHVARCPACARELAGWQRLNASLRAADALPATAAAAAHSTAPFRSRKPITRLRVGVAGAAVSAGVAAVTFYSAPTRQGSALAARAAIEKAMSQVTTAQWRASATIYSKKGDLYGKIAYEYAARLDSPALLEKVQDMNVKGDFGASSMTVDERETYQMRKGKAHAQRYHDVAQFLEPVSPAARTVYDRLRRYVSNGLFSSLAMQKQREREHKQAKQTSSEAVDGGFVKRTIEPSTERLVTRNGQKLLEIHDAFAFVGYKTGFYTTTWASPVTHRVVETQHDTVDLPTKRLLVRFHSDDYRYNQPLAPDTFRLRIPPGTPLRIDGKPAGVTK